MSLVEAILSDSHVVGQRPARNVVETSQLFENHRMAIDNVKVKPLSLAQGVAHCFAKASK